MASALRPANFARRNAIPRIEKVVGTFEKVAR